MFEHFDHTADLGLRVRAASLEELFVEAARGLLAMHVVNPAAVQPVVTKTIELTADDPSYLLFDWLSELLYAFESERLLFSQFEVNLQGDAEQAAIAPTALRLSAICHGEPMDTLRHEMDHEVKAITYHGLKVARQADGTWFAEIIVDI